jgi:hypothetical protein
MFPLNERVISISVFISAVCAIYARNLFPNIITRIFDGDDEHSVPALEEFKTTADDESKSVKTNDDDKTGDDKGDETSCNKGGDKGDDKCNKNRNANAMKQRHNEWLSHLLEKRAKEDVWLACLQSRAAEVRLRMS